jgi:hypothetical protein
VEVTGTRTGRSPEPTRSAARRISSIGPSSERASSTVSSSESVNATPTATSTSTPRSLNRAVRLVDRPDTTTPVTIVMSGSAPRSFHRSGSPGAPTSTSSGRAAEMSRSTGGMASSTPKQRSRKPYISTTMPPATRTTKP